MKVNHFDFTAFPMKMLTFSYLPVTITGLPTYYNRSTGLNSKITDVEPGTEMKETNKEKLGNGETAKQQDGMFEASPKNGYIISMAWEVK